MGDARQMAWGCEEVVGGAGQGNPGKGCWDVGGVAGKWAMTGGDKERGSGLEKQMLPSEL